MPRSAGCHPVRFCYFSSGHLPYSLDAGSTMRYLPAFAALPARHRLRAPPDVAEIDRYL